MVIHKRGITVLGIALSVLIYDGGVDANAQTASVESTSTCQGFAASKRDQTLAEDVVAVRTVRRRLGKQMRFRTLGADVVVKARRGDSAPWLTRLVRCRLAKGWLSGFADAAHQDVDVTVFAVGSEFVVRVTSPVASVGRALAAKTHERWTVKTARL